MKICVIPARGGSKRIPRKNIKAFHGKPLIAYSIETAKATNLFDEIVISTDDEEIAEVARSYGADVPFMRDESLADDYTAATEVIEHTLEKLESLGYKINYACAIYATAPLLCPEYIVKGLNQLKNTGAYYAFSATSMPFPIQRTFKIDEKGRCKMFWPECFSSRSQDLEEAYQDAGQFYWQKRKTSNPPFRFDEYATPVILPRYMVQDIDTLEDWEQAELMYDVVQKIKK